MALITNISFSTDKPNTEQVLSDIKEKWTRTLFPTELFHNLIQVHTRDECDTCFFQVNLTSTVDVTDGEDFAVELSCLPVHPASVIDFPSLTISSPSKYPLKP